MKKVHFIGIAGKAMAPLAKAFVKMGWEVSGSDKEKVYPPISTYLEENNIPYSHGFKKENIKPDIDLVIAGRYSLMFGEGEVEYLEAKRLGLKICSYPEVLREFLIKKNSIVVAGTYGKTTISAIVTWILINSGYNPSYMTGGVPINMEDGLKITDSEWSVVEGDEPPALHEDDLPKFLYYNPKYLILTATKYDHPEVFKDEKAYLSAFSKLVKMVPEDGILVYNSGTVSPSIVKECKGEKIPYSSKDIKAWETSLLGRFNLENITAAFILCSKLGIKEKIILDSVSSFKGVKTRLEYLGEFGGRIIFWDFAQHPDKIKSSLEALREKYHDKKIFCVFDPAMTGLKHRESLDWYPSSFDSADQVILGKVGFLKELKDIRVTGSDIVKAIGKTQKNVFYEPVPEKVIQYIIDNTKKGNVIVFMSSGGLRFTNLIENVKRKLQ